MFPSILLVSPAHVLADSLLPQADRSRVIRVASGKEAAALLRDPGQVIEIVLSLLRGPQIDGLELLATCRMLRPHIDVILALEQPDVQSAVEAGRLGARDILVLNEKPDTLRRKIANALEEKREQRLATFATAHPDDGQSPGRSLSYTASDHQIEAAARSQKRSLLIVGESGTGKEAAAKAIHRSSIRRNFPFATFLCSAAASLDRTLFGTSDRSTPGLIASLDGGTLYLGDIEKLPPEMQRKLAYRIKSPAESLRMKCCIIAGSTLSLSELTTHPQMERELFFALSTFTLKLPTLRSQRDKIRDYALQILKETLSEHPHLPQTRLSANACDLLRKHDWPGNLKELRGCIEAAATLSSSELIDVDDLPFLGSEQETATDSPIEETDWLRMSYREAIEHGKEMAGRAYLQELLQSTGWNISAAARKAGMERQTIHRLIKKYRIDLLRVR